MRQTSLAEHLSGKQTLENLPLLFSVFSLLCTVKIRTRIFYGASSPWSVTFISSPYSFLPHLKRWNGSCYFNRHAEPRLCDLIASVLCSVCPPSLCFGRGPMRCAGVSLCHHSVVVRGSQASGGIVCGLRMPVDLLDHHSLFLELCQRNVLLITSLSLVNMCC